MSLASLIKLFNPYYKTKAEWKEFDEQCFRASLRNLCDSEEEYKAILKSREQEMI